MVMLRASAARENGAFPLFLRPYDDDQEKEICRKKIGPSTADEGKGGRSRPARISAVALCPGL
jgi:hypothetical protein